MEGIAGVHPKLKQNSIFLQTNDGVYFQSEEEAFRLKGKVVGEWIARLGPHLTGEHTLEELCHDLAPEQQGMLYRLVATLLQKGVLKDEQFEDPAVLSTPVRERFQSQISFIDHYAQQPGHRFKTFRESRLLLVGAGAMLKALARSLLRNGLRQILLAPEDAGEPYLQMLAPEVERLQMVGCEVVVAQVTGDVCSESFDLASYDAVVYCGSGSMQELRTLNAHCLQAHCRFLPVTLFAGQAVIGPFVKPSGPCWLCAQMRLRANGSDYQSAAFWREFVLGKDLAVQDVSLFDAVADRIGNGMGFELFKLLSGALPSETENGLIVQDLETLESAHAQVLAHPSCPACSSMDQRLSFERLHAVVEGRRDRVLPYERLHALTSCLIDVYAGIFTRYADDEMQQLPLKRTSIIFGNPGVSSDGQMRVVSASSLQNVLSAYPIVLKKAVASYTQLFCDARCLLFATQHEMIEAKRTCIAAHQLSTWTGADTSHMQMAWIQAYDALSMTYRYVPAAAVYPASQLNSMHLFHSTSAGQTVGTCYHEMLDEGLRSALAYQHLRDLLHRRVKAIEVDPQAFEDTDIQFLMKSVSHAKQRYAVVEVCQHSPLSVVVASTINEDQPPVTTFGYGLSRQEAVTMSLQALVEALQDTQAENEQQAFFPDFSPASDFAYVDTALPPSATSDEQLQEYVRQSGYSLLFVHTTPGDIWETKTLLSGRVLLAKW